LDLNGRFLKPADKNPRCAHEYEIILNPQLFSIVANSPSLTNVTSMSARTKSRAKLRPFIAFAIFALYAVHYFRSKYNPPDLWSHGELNRPASKADNKPTTISSWCKERFSHEYLQNLRDFSTNYCSADNRNEIQCYHSRTAEEDRTDSFCVLNSTTVDDEWKTFHTQCRPRKLTNAEKARGVPRMDNLSSYWYGTGAGVLMEKWVRLDDPSEKKTTTAQATALKDVESPPSFLMLVTREGDGSNIWHTFMEVMSATMTLDVLQLASKAEKPVLSPHEARNGQIAILEEYPQDPFFDLWKIATPNYKLLRRSDLKASSFSNTKLILPLAGGGNPFWQGDWKLYSCGTSTLLHTFLHRVLDFYDISHKTERKTRKTTITFIDRKEKRHWVDQEKLLARLRRRYPSAKIQAVDFAAYSLKDQIRIARKTDVLVGIHGAGLTHSLFLEPGSAVVEILPEGVDFKGFENIARHLNVQYFSANASGSSSPDAVDKGWQFDDVIVDHRDVVKRVDAAIQGLGTR
jgi:protein O-GlcNAc transferase